MNLDGRVIYQVDPATFYDNDGDGTGDLNGVRRKLDHVRAVGADTVWLQPFYVSPYRDGGYDIVDHRGVTQRFGTMADFDELVSHCHQLDLRVVVGLVVQHTSIDHPWFRSAREEAGSQYRDFYVWAAEPHDDPVVKQPVFAGVEDSIWAYDDHAGKYHRHAFYAHQPDLDVGNPAVREKIAKIIQFWVDHGVDGFRVDAVPHMVRQAAVTDDRDNGYWFLSELAADAQGVLLLTDAERNDVMAAFAPDKDMQVFGRGIRRRLGPMLGDVRRIAMAHAINQSLPGIPRGTSYGCVATATAGCV